MPVNMALASKSARSWDTLGPLDHDPEIRRFLRLLSMAERRISQGPGLVAYVVGAVATVETAMAFFRAWNVPGVPIHPDEVERLIRDADQAWIP